LYEEYAGVVAYVEVEKPDGSRGIGSAFHVGDGVFVTAAHVTRGNRVLSVATTQQSRWPDENGNITIHGREGKFKSSFPSDLRFASEPFYHPDERIDVAAIQIDLKETLPAIPLGSHLDDWLGNDFTLSRALIFGYPPIPFTSEPVLIGSIGEINAVVDLYN
jgi:hypothetical protein